MLASRFRQHGLGKVSGKRATKARIVEGLDKSAKRTAVNFQIGGQRAQQIKDGKENVAQQHQRRSGVLLGSGRLAESCPE